ncbi:NAD(P)H-hydrate dehydratase [Vibrio sp. 404]|uniref:Bifunctional NAD(P)H-hydrate repair enzyme n=1 Tax=Vibrio marinisediminis TaxID=2758441 RepID=A0A7W2FML2_9VIBR|nr:NAD(P)H-hydrate dehydratase [Vibrio marinisediminis]MBA5760874.1 NAD(P)H-hydrate dehydratase [Vibrio marinisediminis]
MSHIAPFVSHPQPLFRAQQVKKGEVDAAKLAGFEMYSLMQSAGEAVFNLVIDQYGREITLLILCGGGNNGGDGYIVGQRAIQSGINVTLWALVSPDKLTDDAKRAYHDFVLAGGQVKPVKLEQIGHYDVVVDALLGTGLSGTVRDEMRIVIEKVNDAHVATVSVDLPSGLCSDTGSVLGCCIQAAHTMTFIGIKQGLVTGQARAFVGDLHFSGLAVHQHFERIQNTKVWWDSAHLIQALRQRSPCAHKGSQGKALLVGGDYGLGGAVLIAAHACLKSGAGLTACLTQEKNMIAGLVATPEVMFSHWSEDNCQQRLAWCDAFALGPGLGRESHSKQLFDFFSSTTLPKVLDADALHFLAIQPNYDDQRIITPHPGEAAKLLDCTVTEIEQNRYRSVVKLQQCYGGVVVLKGAGTLVCSEHGTYVCSAGNAGMATGGMGDALTGVIVSLLAQGRSLEMAARKGVMLHSCAADYNVATYGLIGLCASDVVNSIRHVIHHT